MSEKKNITGLISICVMAVVGLALTPSIQGQVTRFLASGKTGDLNLTISGSTRAIISLFTLFWVILMIAIPVAYIVVWLRK